MPPGGGEHVADVCSRAVRYRSRRDRSSPGPSSTFDSHRGGTGARESERHRSTGPPLTDELSGDATCRQTGHANAPTVPVATSLGGLPVLAPGAPVPVTTATVRPLDHTHRRPNRCT